MRQNRTGRISGAGIASIAAFTCFTGLAAGQDAGQAAAGEEIFESNCAPCHGERISNPNGIFDLKELKSTDRPRFDKALREGKGQMPSWEGTLAPEEQDQVWAYIRSMAD